MDKIIIKDASFLCNIGVTSKERRKKQEILTDAELFLDIKKAAQIDDIKYTVNYSDVHDLLKNIAEKNEYRLIETMAENMAKEILDKFPVDKIAIKIKKLSALADRNVKYVGVEIVRSKNFQPRHASELVRNERTRSQVKG